MNREDAKGAKGREPTRKELESLATTLADAVFVVHSALGPGLLESAYQACLAVELRARGIEVVTEVAFPVHYRETAVEVGYRVDMVVGGSILVENKAVKELVPIHEAQLLTYLKLSGLKLGFLINWNVPRIKEGITRMVNGL